jgi:AcrR family transcriptional regulator
MQPAPIKTKRPSRARERLLETASSLFYTDGIRAVGVDRVVGEANVTRATFYRHFPGKDELVRAYLEREHLRVVEVISGVQRDAPDPAARLQRVLDSIVEDAARPGFRGCAFINAANEYTDPAHPVRRVVRDHRAWLHEALREVLAANEHPEPVRAARTLVLLCDGATVGAHLDDREQVRTAFLDAASVACAR